MQDSFWINMGISTVLTLLSETIKSPAAKAKYKRAMLKIYKSIKFAFADDPDFE